MRTVACSIEDNDGLIRQQSTYVTGLGGFAATTDTISGNVMGEVGVRVAPHLDSADWLGHEDAKTRNINWSS